MLGCSRPSQIKLPTSSAVRRCSLDAPTKLIRSIGGGPLTLSLMSVPARFARGRFEDEVRVARARDDWGLYESHWRGRRACHAHYYACYEETRDISPGHKPLLRPPSVRIGIRCPGLRAYGRSQPQRSDENLIGLLHRICSTGPCVSSSVGKTQYKRCELVLGSVTVVHDLACCKINRPKRPYDNNWHRTLKSWGMDGQSSS